MRPSGSRHSTGDVGILTGVAGVGRVREGNGSATIRRAGDLVSTTARLASPAAPGYPACGAVQVQRSSSASTSSAQRSARGSVTRPPHGDRRAIPCTAPGMTT